VITATTSAHRSDYRNTLIYAQTISRTLPTGDIILGLLALHAQKLRDFMELITQYMFYLSRLTKETISEEEGKM